jgi:nucleoside-diphosphate-sugar epimerase
VIHEFWSSKRVLVGGGCGFLGSYLVPQLVASGAHVLVVDNLENGSPDRLDAVASDIQLEVADLSEPRVAAKVTANQDVVINLAARACGMEYSRTHNGEMLVSNLLSTLVPLEQARLNGVPRYAIISSSCVYPDDAPIPTPELDVFSGLPESVNEGYGWAKRMQELAGSYYAQDYGMKVTIVRPFNPYGGNYRWGSEDKAHVVPALVKRVLDGEDPLIVWGSGQQRRNFLHAADATALILRVIASDRGPAPVNIGFDDDISIKELVDLICRVAGVAPATVFDTTKPEGRFRKCADPTRLNSIAADYTPQVSLQSGIEEMVAWYYRSFPRAVPSLTLPIES